jgi:hypothetical protein
MSSSDSELNVRPDAVPVVKEDLNSDYIIILTSNSEIMELTVTKHIPGLFSKVEHININVYNNCNLTKSIMLIMLQIIKMSCTSW